MNSRNPGPLVLIVAVLSFSACKKEFITVREGEWEGVAPSETFSDSLAAPFAIDDCTSQEVMGLSLDPGTLHPGDLIRAVLNVGLSQVSDPPSSLCNGLEPRALFSIVERRRSSMTKEKKTGQPGIGKTSSPVRWSTGSPA